jgi:hypothetical protein
MRIKEIVLSIIVLFTSCNYREKDLVGTYTPKDYKYTFDTIQLKENNTYYRKVYNSNKKLVLEINGEWSLKGDLIVFKSPYFANLDRDLVAFPELLQDSVSNGIGYIWLKNGNIEFCVGVYSVDLPNQNCYCKLE